MDKNLITVLLSGGNQAPWGTLAFALFFVAFRCVLIVVIPAWVTWRLVVVFAPGSAPSDSLRLPPPYEPAP
jgi:hypothetical protein